MKLIPKKFHKPNKFQKITKNLSISYTFFEMVYAYRHVCAHLKGFLSPIIFIKNTCVNVTISEIIVNYSSFKILTTEHQTFQGK